MQKLEEVHFSMIYVLRNHRLSLWMIDDRLFNVCILQARRRVHNVMARVKLTLLNILPIDVSHYQQIKYFVMI